MQIAFLPSRTQHITCKPQGTYSRRVLIDGHPGKIKYHLGSREVTISVQTDIPIVALDADGTGVSTLTRSTEIILFRLYDHLELFGVYDATPGTRTGPANRAHFDASRDAALIAAIAQATDTTHPTAGQAHEHIWAAVSTLYNAPSSFDWQAFQDSIHQPRYRMDDGTEHSLHSLGQRFLPPLIMTNTKGSLIPGHGRAHIITYAPSIGGTLYYLLTKWHGYNHPDRRRLNPSISQHHRMQAHRTLNECGISIL